MDSEVESDVDDVVVADKRKKPKKTERDDAAAAADDGYVRPDKCEFCGISFAGTTASQWNRRNIEVHTNSKVCQNNQKKLLKMSGGGADGDNESTVTKTPKTPKGIYLYETHISCFKKSEIYYLKNQKKSRPKLPRPGHRRMSRNRAKRN